MGFWRKEQITFFMTNSCNLSCIYCYMPKIAGKYEQQAIDTDFARRGLVDFFEASSSRTIRFFGSGEPTVAFDAMKKIWDIAYDLAGDDLRVELETNGVFGQKVADWIAQHVNYLWISCDGNAAIQDAQRPTVGGGASSSQVNANIARFCEVDGLQFGVRPTVSHENLAKQTDLIEYFHEVGVRYVCASPTYHSVVNETVITPPLSIFAQHFVPAYYRARELGMLYQSLMTVNFDEEVDIYCQAHIPTPRLTTDGYVSCCDWASFGPDRLPNEIQQEMVYGRYDKLADKIIYDKDKINKIRSRNADFMGRTFCRDCRALTHCVGGCVGKMAAATSDFFRPSPEWCEAVLYLFDRLPIKQGLYPVLHP